MALREWPLRSIVGSAVVAVWTIAHLAEVGFGGAPVPGAVDNALMTVLGWFAVGAVADVVRRR